MDAAISIQQLSKRYTRSGSEQPYLALRDVLANAFKRKEPKTEFWALQDVSFDVQPGERIGIIGRNGAGKSTLLKIISRITPPTKGRVEINGRVASLLEVGTGFHSELSGMENIFLNGSILGLTRKEIRGRLDEIIAFSGVEAFINTPLKHYSSGMQLRLAFSVAAHLEAEILLIDEVLAVGDLEFQKRCIGKMDEISNKDGRTVLFVSHNLNQIRHFCNRAVLLDAGRLVQVGGVEQIMNRYASLTALHGSAFYEKQAASDFTITSVSLLSDGSLANAPVKASAPFCVDVCLEAHRPVLNSLLALRFTNAENVPVFTTTNADEALAYAPLPEGRHCFRVPVDLSVFVPGRYSVIVAWNTPNVQELDKVEDLLSFEITDEEYPGAILGDGRQGVLNKKISWTKIS